jgi:hypothetical protein
MGKKKHAVADGTERQAPEVEPEASLPQTKNTAVEESRPTKKARTAIDDIFAKAKPAAPSASDAVAKDGNIADKTEKPVAKQVVSKQVRHAAVMFR